MGDPLAWGEGPAERPGELALPETLSASGPVPWALRMAWLEAHESVPGEQPPGRGVFPTSPPTLHTLTWSEAHSPRCLLTSNEGAGRAQAPGTSGPSSPEQLRDEVRCQPALFPVSHLGIGNAPAQGLLRIRELMRVKYLEAHGPRAVVDNG